jgi:hypothetical protein
LGTAGGLDSDRLDVTYSLSLLLVFCTQCAGANLTAKEIHMRQTTPVTYLFDPLCGWCYGASATVRRLAAHPDFAVKLAPTGLFRRRRGTSDGR